MSALEEAQRAHSEALETALAEERERGRVAIQEAAEEERKKTTQLLEELKVRQCLLLYVTVYFCTVLYTITRPTSIVPLTHHTLYTPPHTHSSHTHTHTLLTHTHTHTPHTHTHTPHTQHTRYAHTLRDPRRLPWKQRELRPGRKCPLPWNKRGRGQRSVFRVRTMYNSDVSNP